MHALYILVGLQVVTPGQLRFQRAVTGPGPLGDSSERLVNTKILRLQVSKEGKSTSHLEQEATAPAFKDGLKPGVCGGSQIIPQRWVGLHENLDSFTLSHPKGFFTSDLLCIAPSKEESFTVPSTNKWLYYLKLYSKNIESIFRHNII